MINGQRVTLSYEDQHVPGTVIMGSDNRKSLMVTLESALWIKGGFYVSIPLMQADSSEMYRDLLHGAAIEVEWIDA